MTIQKTYGVSFSATGTTRRIIETILEPLPQAELLDCVRPGSLDGLTTLGASDLLVAGIPVFAGRVPSPALERLGHLRGGNTLCVAVAVYGNREYEDALLELSDTLTSQGFVVIAAAAFIGQHSVVPSIAAGRPDGEDLETARQFGHSLLRKLETLEAPGRPVPVPGNTPYRDTSPMPFRPHAGKACTKCGTCSAECPMGAIPAHDPAQTDKELCITCMRCVAVCPSHARGFSALESKMSALSLAPKCKVIKKPELFL